MRGKVRLSKDQQVLAELVAGNFVGSALLLSGAPAEVDALTMEPVRAMRWEIGTLERYLAANPETRIIMQRHLARDLAGKLVAYAGAPVTEDTNCTTQNDRQGPNGSS